MNSLWLKFLISLSQPTPCDKFKHDTRFAQQTLKWQMYKTPIAVLPGQVLVCWCISMWNAQCTSRSAHFTVAQCAKCAKCAQLHISLNSKFCPTLCLPCMQPHSVYCRTTLIHDDQVKWSLCSFATKSGCPSQSKSGWSTQFHVSRRTWLLKPVSHLIWFLW